MMSVSDSKFIQFIRQFDVVRADKTRSCPNCGNTGGVDKPLRAVISPWIRELAGIRKRISNLYSCENCKSSFFDFRYDENQMQRIYQSYRGRDYVKTRQKWEPWYTPDFNNGHESIDYISERKTALEEFLFKSGIKNVESVLDLGGDTGSLIPDFLSDTKKYVLDYSDRPCVDGVTKVKSISAIPNLDLVIYSHVLEHVSEPLLELQNILNLTQRAYIEVPCGTPNRSSLRKSRIVQMIVAVFAMSPISWSKLTRPSTGRLNLNGVLRQSEHLSFYEAETFKVMAQKIGFNVTIQISNSISPDFSKVSVIRAIFEMRM